MQVFGHVRHGRGGWPVAGVALESACGESWPPASSAPINSLAADTTAPQDGTSAGN